MCNSCFYCGQCDIFIIQEEIYKLIQKIQNCKIYDAFYIECVSCDSSICHNCLSLFIEKYPSEYEFNNDEEEKVIYSLSINKCFKCRK
jgi:hypothetical protein